MARVLGPSFSRRGVAVRRNSSAATPAGTTSTFIWSPGSTARTVGGTGSLSALDAQRKLRRGRAALRLLSPADLDAGRGAGACAAVDAGSHCADFLLLAATGLATRALARQALPTARQRWPAARPVLRLRAVHCLRAIAFGELTGGFWIPLLLLSRCETATHLGGQIMAARIRRLNAAPLALVVAGAWLSNAPSA
jgi:hypothetical protein